MEEAENVARQCIEGEGWQIIETEDVRVVGDSDYSVDDAGREYFEQALIDKEVFLFNSYPLDEAD